MSLENLHAAQTRRAICLGFRAITLCHAIDLNLISTTNLKAMLSEFEFVSNNA